MENTGVGIKNLIDEAVKSGELKPVNMEILTLRAIDEIEKVTGRKIDINLSPASENNAK